MEDRGKDEEKDRLRTERDQKMFHVIITSLAHRPSLRAFFPHGRERKTVYEASFEYTAIYVCANFNQKTIFIMLRELTTSPFSPFVPASPISPFGPVGPYKE